MLVITRHHAFLAFHNPRIPSLRRLCSFPVEFYQSCTEIFVFGCKPRAKYYSPVIFSYQWLAPFRPWMMYDFSISWYPFSLHSVLARYLDTRFLFAMHSDFIPFRKYYMIVIWPPVTPFVQSHLVLRKQSHLFRARPVEHFKVWFWYINSYIDSYIKL